MIQLIQKKAPRKIKVLVIEDDPTWALFIESAISGSVYELVGSANTIEKAKAMIDGFAPDLIISDIKVQDSTIFDLLKIEKYNNYTMLFMTSHLEGEFYDLTHETPKSTYLAKPFHKFTLLSALELLLSKYPIQDSKSSAFITVRGLQQQAFKVKLHEITWIQSEGNYSFVNTVDGKKHAKKKSLSKLFEELDSRFLIVHRGFAINTDYIQRIELSKKTIYVQDNAIPIGRNFRDSLDGFLHQKY